ncbi:MAG: dTDP-4-dehydrorhamnose reductase [Oxalobacteraceae bacterium]|nr:dTDP-4-dehydrorhamnose reductase [Oxalobacteraceae bacterium]
MRILVLGRSGQVGTALTQSLQGLGELIALDRAQLDLTNPDAIRTTLREMQPQIVINAAAYTAVDAAESDQAMAFQINAVAPRVMAEESERLGAALIHYSTDYVFNGGKQGAWMEDDATAPLSVYGHSKLAGEQAITDVGGTHLILRTSWVYGLHGKNFLLTMLKLAESRDSLAIVDDQIGAPTWALTIADATSAIIRDAGEPAQLAALSGIYHLCAGGHTSWFGFAQAIFSHASVQRKPQLRPITTAEYPTPAQRPHNSILNTDKFRRSFGDLPTWDDALQTCLQMRSGLIS